MALEIFWTLRAKNNLKKVVDYLDKYWTEKEILKLEQKIDELLKRISQYPEICPKTSKQKNVYKGLIDKNNYLIYKVNPRKKTIDIINFRGTKQERLFGENDSFL